MKVGQKFVRDRAGVPEPEPDEELLRPEGASMAPAAPASTDAPTDKIPPPDKSARTDKSAPAQNKTQLALGECCPNCGGSSRFVADDPTAPLDESGALADADALVEEALANDGWREIRDPLLAGLLAAVGESTSYDDLLARLDTAKIDSGPLVEKLSLTTTKARLSGGSAD